MNLPIRIRSMLKYGILSLSLLVLLGLILSSYSAIKYIAIGAAVFLGLLLDITHFNLRGTFILLFIVPCLWLCYGLYFGLRFPSGRAPPCGRGALKSSFELTGYSAEIEPMDLAAGSFRVNEQIVYKEWEAKCNGFEWEYDKVIQEEVKQDLPGRIVKSTKSGLFLHEVIIPYQLQDYDCCPDEGKVRIKELPDHSFYDAQYANDLNVDEYLGIQTISWTTSDIGADLRFAYLPHPFYYVRGLLDPVIDLSKTDNWILAVFGSAASYMILSVIKPFLLDGVKNKLKSIFVQDDSNQDDSNSPPKPPTRRKNRNQ